jgi:hypothetical protein
MPTSQQTADEAVIQWQSLRSEGLSPGERLEVLMRDFFAPVPPGDIEYDLTLRDVAEQMAA